MDNVLVPDLLLNVSECNYLGTIICEKNCDQDIIRQTRNCYANANVYDYEMNFLRHQYM